MSNNKRIFSDTYGKKPIENMNQFTKIPGLQEKGMLIASEIDCFAMPKPEEITIIESPPLNNKVELPIVDHIYGPIVMDKRILIDIK